VSGLLETVSANIRSRKLPSKGQRLIVAVSGGVDSLVLLHMVHRLAATNRWQITVAHLNHRLRGHSSNADERLVRQTARQLNLPVVVGMADVRRFARDHKISVEMAARKLRHDFLARTAVRLKIPVIALAHHADDQVELFFLRLLRGSGGEGLSGMKWTNPSPGNSKIALIRPLLDQPKSALLEYAAANKIRFREDATNASRDILRNRIRHELLPLLRKKYQPALNQTILRVMDIVGVEADFVSDSVSQSLAVKPGQSRNGPERFDALPIALQRRRLHLQLIKHSIPPSYELIEGLRQHPNHPISIPNLKGSTFLLRDSAGLIQLHTASTSEFPTHSVPVGLTRKEGAFEFEGVHIKWRRVPGKFLGPPKRQTGSEQFDAGRIGGRILVRHWHPGDRFQPIGMKSPIKLQDLFTNAKIKRAERHRLVVAVAADGGIFWVEGLRISERYKLAKSTIRRLHWRWRRL
jgi:tRNA(Ile)-lysidine synthase